MPVAVTSNPVPVPVPQQFLPDVFSLLAELTAPEPRAEAPSTDDDFWHDPANVKHHLRPRSQTIRDLAKYLASRPDQEVTADQAAQALGLQFGWNSLAGALGAFGRYCANRGLEFPWEDWYDQNDGRVRMRIDAATAAVVLQEL